MTLFLGPDLEGRSLVTREGTIASFDKTTASADPALTKLDCSGCQIEPGRVNAHTHIYSGRVPLGMPEPEVPP